MDTPTNIDQRVSELGYRPELRRQLHVWHVAGLAIALFGPTATVVIFGTVVFFVGGIFATHAAVIVNLFAIPIALILAELGALYPLTGGIYSLTSRVLPGAFKWIAAFNVLVMGLGFLAAASIGIVPFLRYLFPALNSVPDKVLGVVVLFTATAIALVKVELGAIINAILIIVECIALGTITLAGILHPHQSLPEILFHPTLLNGAELVSVSSGVMLITLPAAFIMLASPELVLGFSEELKGDTKTLARTVIFTTLLIIPLVVIPIFAAVVAAPDLVAFLQSPTPVAYAVQEAFGSGIALLVNLCVTVSLFTAMIGALMYFPRVFYATGRDGLWWKWLCRYITLLNRYQVPGTAVLTITFITLLLIFVGAFNWLVILLASCSATLYFIVGLMGLWTRMKYPHELRPYRMPLWPVFPIIVIIFAAFVLYNQDKEHLVGSIVLDAAAVLVWYSKKKLSQ